MATSAVFPSWAFAGLVGLRWPICFRANTAWSPPGCRKGFRFDILARRCANDDRLTSKRGRCRWYRCMACRRSTAGDDFGDAAAITAYDARCMLSVIFHGYDTAVNTCRIAMAGAGWSAVGCVSKMRIPTACRFHGLSNAYHHACPPG